MKFQPWVAMQSIGTLEKIDFMLPDLVTVDDIWETRRRKLRDRNPQRRSTSNGNGVASFRAIIGGILVAWGLAMLAPGPIDLWFAKKGAEIGFLIGSAFGPMAALVGGVIGAVVAVVAYNLFALAVVAIGTYLIVTG